MRSHAVAFASTVERGMRLLLRDIVKTTIVAARLTSLRLRLRALLEDGPLHVALGHLDPVATIARRSCADAPSGAVVRGIRLGEAVVRGLRRVRVPDTCLYRSCARYALLRQNGVAAEIVLGVRGLHGNIEAHAWVEIGGTAFLEVVDRQLVVNFRYPPRTAPGPHTPAWPRS